MTAHLDRLLFAQGGQCFFCRKPLPKAEASVEHLVATANGGTNDEGNCVACCKTLNHLLGAKPIREKMQIVLNQRGNFQCPAVLAQASCLPPTASASPANAVTPKPTPPHASANSTQTAFDLVVSDLKKRGASRLRKVATLSSIIQALLKNQQRAQSVVLRGAGCWPLQPFGHSRVNGCRRARSGLRRLYKFREKLH